jgi:septal ring factor EnvC (AmiA/AmiB activator)
MNNYTVESLEGAIQKCKDNIKIFEEAIEKERETIKDLHNKIELLEVQERERKRIEKELMENIEVEVE